MTKTIKIDFNKEVLFKGYDTNAKRLLLETIQCKNDSALTLSIEVIMKCATESVETFKQYKAPNRHQKSTLKCEIDKYSKSNPIQIQPLCELYIKVVRNNDIQQKDTFCIIEYSLL